MKDKKLYIISGIIMVVSVVILLVFIFLPASLDNNIKPLNFVVEDVELKVGEIKSDFYSVSDENAEITFSVSENGIINIDKNKIEAISVGHVIVSVTITLNSQSVNEYFTVIVYENNYEIKLNIHEGGEIVDDTLYLTQDLCLFTAILYDKYGEEVACLFEISASDGAVIQSMYGVFRLLATSSCDIIIKVPQYELEKTLHVAVK